MRRMYWLTLLVTFSFGMVVGSMFQKAYTVVDHSHWHFIMRSLTFL
jgi:hypothetical protein